VSRAPVHVAVLRSMCSSSTSNRTVHTHNTVCWLLQELEALRAEGKIRSYGMATWDSFRTTPDSLLVRHGLCLIHLYGIRGAVEPDACRFVTYGCGNSRRVCGDILDMQATHTSKAV
jgi:hypothetical protein